MNRQICARATRQRGEQLNDSRQRATSALDAATAAEFLACARVVNAAQQLWQSIEGGTEDLSVNARCGHARIIRPDPASPGCDATLPAARRTRAGMRE